MVLSASIDGKPMAKEEKQRCSRGLTMKEPAVGFIAARYCVLSSTFWLSLFMS